MWQYYKIIHLENSKHRKLHQHGLSQQICPAWVAPAGGQDATIREFRKPLLAIRDFRAAQSQRPLLGWMPHMSICSCPRDGLWWRRNGGFEYEDIYIQHARLGHSLKFQNTQDCTEVSMNWVQNKKPSISTEQLRNATAVSFFHRSPIARSAKCLEW